MRFRHVQMIGITVLLLLMLPVQAQDMLTQDEAITVTVTADAAGQALFTGRAGDALIFRADAQDDDFDTVIWIVAPDDTQLAYADNPAAVRVQIPADGDYLIYVDSFNGVTAGEVRVQVEQAVEAAQLVDAETGVVVAEDALLPARTRAEATLTRDTYRQVRRWTMMLAAGDTLTLTARDTSGTLDPLLRVRDSAGEMLAFNDDHADGDNLAALRAGVDFSLTPFDARIQSWEVPDDGRYTVEVWDFAGWAGTFVLELCRNTETCP